ncbi:C2 domain-containing protein [Trifolium repens]|nr:C2 domain-containing protein [Trifolium repens]KAK2402476.1 C2 domain-containing protein [Trifolium repens]KAK2435027.1 C2 domain-containing protein [Trifolium repens]KAK2440743.1 C2 domain-containing protein [Trifolium repens]WJX58269.1 C2 domain-containing protein [Trifolium repens]
MSCSIASFASSTSIFHFILQLSYAGEAKYFIFHSIYFDFCAIEKWVCSFSNWVHGALVVWATIQVLEKV